MDTTKIIKRFVILELTLMITGFVLSFSLESKLPDLLQEYLAFQSESDINTTDLFVLCSGIPLMIIYLVAAVGLLLTKTWAKNLYALGTIAGLLLSPFLGPTVEHAMTAATFELSSLTEGAILALLFFSNSAFKENASRDASHS